MELDPRNKKLNCILYSNRGLCYMREGKNTEALKDFNSSLELDDKYVKSYLRRAEAKNNLG